MVCHMRARPLSGGNADISQICRMSAFDPKQTSSNLPAKIPS
jgi:hypothetical protein